MYSKSEDVDTAYPTSDHNGAVERSRELDVNHCLTEIFSHPSTTGNTIIQLYLALVILGCNATVVSGTTI